MNKRQLKKIKKKIDKIIQEMKSNMVMEVIPVKFDILKKSSKS